MSFITILVTEHDSKLDAEAHSMIAGIFHQGSGLGNQLHRYVATRVCAADKKKAFGMVNSHLFKGSAFMTLDVGGPIGQLPNRFEEKKIVVDGVDVRGYDPEFDFIEDNTIIDGEFQDPKYFEHRLSDVDRWLQVEPFDIPDDVCVIGFRGGEYTVFPDLFLTKEYWDEAIAMMPGKRFVVHTDDKHTARHFFPDFPIIQDMEINWRAMRYAKNSIIANSSFYILPRLLSGGTTIAPRYWARRNTKIWALPQNYYKQFDYI